MANLRKHQTECTFKANATPETLGENQAGKSNKVSDTLPVRDTIA